MTQKLIASLVRTPSLLVIDPISLYNTDLGEIFKGLNTCFQNDDVVVICPSPRQLPDADALMEALVRTIGFPHFESYFEPLPPPPKYPVCGVNLSHEDQLRRLISQSLGRRLWTTENNPNAYTPHPGGPPR